MAGEHTTRKRILLQHLRNLTALVEAQPLDTCDMPTLERMDTLADSIRRCIEGQTDWLQEQNELQYIASERNAGHKGLVILEPHTERDRPGDILWRVRYEDNSFTGGFVDRETAHYFAVEGGYKVRNA